MSTSFDVIVVGGGLVGASLAATLEPLGYSVALVEPHGAPRLPAPDGWDARVYSVSPGSASLLAACGAWGDVSQERVCRIEAMQIYGDDTTSSLRFSAYDAGLRELAFVVENGVLHHALWQRLAQASGIRVYSPASCVSLLWEERRVSLELSGGERLTAALIVGADGADSWVREQAGMETLRMPYAETGVVANFATSRPHRGVAYQWFGRHGVLALLPLPGDRVSMVWSTPDAHAHDLLGLAPDALCEAVAEASADVVGRLELITPPAGFPLKLQRVSRLVGAHVALVGDAAHSLHPLAGQGVNLGFRDVRDLAAVLGARDGHLNCGDHGLLRRYERARAEDIAAMRLVTDGLQKLFRADAVWLARLRNLGLTLVGKAQPLRNLLIRHAIA